MTDNTSELYIFKVRMLEFIDELIEQFPHEPSFIMIRIFVCDKIPTQTVLGRFMKECLPYKEYVFKKDANFFLYSDFMYEKYSSNVGEERISNFRNLWESNKLDQDDKEAVWKWLALFIKLAQSYYDKFGCVEGWEFSLDSEIDNIKIEVDKFNKSNLLK